MEAMLLERDQQLKRFSEAYTKQYETALEEHTKKLMEEFTRLKQGYEDSAKREIASSVASVN
jgi:hypothetical protein